MPHVVCNARHRNPVYPWSVTKVRTAFVVMVAACGSSAMPDAPASPWRLADVALPSPRLEPGVTALGQRLALIGGFDTDLAAGLHITSRVDLLDTLAIDAGWTSMMDVPVAWTHLQIAGVGDTLYVLGGLDGQLFTARGEAYALDTLAPTPMWRALSSLPAGSERGSAAIVIVPPRIYLLGGASSTAALASNIYYDIQQDAWCPGAACTAAEQLPDLPQPRSHPAAMRRVDGSLIVVGGLATLTSDSQTSDVWILPPSEQHAGGQWTAKTPMPSARGGCAYGVLQGQLVCAGGEAGTTAFDITESYDPLETDPLTAWTTLDRMPMPRAGTQGVAIGQQLYVPGGARRLAFEPTDTLYVFAPLDTAARP
jgi:N-acetylneuraminic acid mutarotase